MPQFLPADVEAPEFFDYGGGEDFDEGGLVVPHVCHSAEIREMRFQQGFGGRLAECEKSEADSLGDVAFGERLVFQHQRYEIGADVEVNGLLGECRPLSMSVMRSKSSRISQEMKRRCSGLEDCA